MAWVVEWVAVLSGRAEQALSRVVMINREVKRFIKIPLLGRAYH
ncbi:hypothetical protein [Moraxella lacunata]